MLLVGKCRLARGTLLRIARERKETLPEESIRYLDRYRTNIAVDISSAALPAYYVTSWIIHNFIADEA